jgi:carbon-monoxide dehydrogenase small subunit
MNEQKEKTRGNVPISMIPITLTVNGHPCTAEVSPTLRLLDFLRDHLYLTGAKEGCGEGECGACTVLMDGRAVLSCLVLAFQADGREILTVEGLARSGLLDPLQQSFIDHGAIQCGYCTPGMLMSAKGLQMIHPAPSEQEIRTALSGNMCRCTGYVKIIAAVRAAADSNAAEVTRAAGTRPAGVPPFQPQTTPFGKKQ